MKSSNFGRHEQRKQELSSCSEIAHSSIVRTTISTHEPARTEEQASKIVVEICQSNMFRIKRVHLAGLQRLPHVLQQGHYFKTMTDALSPPAIAANSPQQVSWHTSESRR